MRGNSKNTGGPRRPSRIREIRVIGADGSQFGIMTPQEALEKAYVLGLDLVEAAPEARPPICKTMDYRRFQEERSRKD